MPISDALLLSIVSDAIVVMNRACIMRRVVAELCLELIYRMLVVVDFYTVFALSFYGS